MKKIYITPETEAVEVNEADIITTSAENEWELDASNLFSGTELADLFGSSNTEE